MVKTMVMGFYLRKSIRVGPLRFNLSNSGVGVSAGIKGFRVGSGPRGNYVHMGRGGIYFRTSLPAIEHPRNVPVSPPLATDRSGIELEEIESGSVMRMVDSSSAELLQEINTKLAKLSLWPWILAICLTLLPCQLVIGISPWWYALTIPVCIAGVFATYWRDQLRKTVVLFYEFEPHLEEAYQKLHSTFNTLASCRRVWHIPSKGRVTTTYQWKTNAGASSVVRRKAIRPHFGAPPYLKSNVVFPILAAGRQMLYFLPDRILVYDGSAVGAVSYEQLTVYSGETRFVEEEGVPSDARVVDRTWRYVNKSGGPDRRFKSNYELPICVYGEFSLVAKAGLREAFKTSRTGIGTLLQISISEMASAIEARSVVEQGFYRCACSNCGCNIEFPTHGVGETILCPHCNSETVLFNADENKLQ